MTLHRAVLDLDQVLHVPTGCPTCGGALTAVGDGERGNSLCGDCGRCWHLELDFFARVDARTCGPCAHRGECRADAPDVV